MNSSIVACVVALALPLGCGSSAAPRADGVVADGAVADGAVADGAVADGARDGTLKEDAATCVPRGFAAPGSPVGFEHTTTKLVVVTQGPANHRGQDVVAVAGAAQVLIGKFAYGPFDKDLVDEEVETFIQRAPPCGPWTSLGRKRTSKKGQYGTTYGIADTGGRVFLTIPVREQLPMGRYPVRMLVRGDHSVAAFSLFVVEAGSSAVIFDIDGTLTTGDGQLAAELFAKLLGGSYKPIAREDGRDVVRAWVQKGYLPVYLTARPDWLRGTSQAWLVAGGFPSGVLHLTDTNAQALPANTDEYKTAFLERLKTEAGVDLVAAYGNAANDIVAYERAKIPKERTFIVGSRAGSQGTVAVPNYTSHLPQVQAMPKAAVAAPTETYGW